MLNSKNEDTGVGEKSAQDYLDLIEANWSAIGICGSCGWHALFHEHGLDDWDIGEAQDNDGDMIVYCISKDDEDSVDHRGAKFNIYELAAASPSQVTNLESPKSKGGTE
jgi:hypothetical protein